MKLRGVIVPAATPLDADGALDQAAFGRLLAFLVQNRVDAIFANGSMGAFALLPDSEQIAAVEAAVRSADGKVPVLAGASESGTARVLAKIRQLSRSGADAFVVLPPYYYLLSQRELLHFYFSVADASPKPIVAYDNPRLTKNPIFVATVAELAGHPNIAGIKVSNSDALYWQDLIGLNIDRNKFSLISGAGKLNSLALRLGFDGITEGLHNVVPNLAVALFEASARGDFDTADRIQRKINRCFRIFEVDGGWRGLELAFQHMGIATRAAAAPYDLPISAAHREEILRVLEQEEIPRPYIDTVPAGQE
jgi:4-hydroxy-tetrahydrodipicolinate synthase